MARNPESILGRNWKSIPEGKDYKKVKLHPQRQSEECACNTHNIASAN